MNYNPYAAPQAPPPPFSGSGALPAGAPRAWEVGEVFGVAWEAFKRNWSVLVFSYLLASLLAMIPYFAFSVPLLLTGAADPKAPGAVLGLLVPGYLATFVGLMFFYVGLVRIWVTAARGGEPSFALLFSGASRFLPFLGAGLLSILAVYAGMILLIVPGVVLACGWTATSFYVVDAELGAIDALKASWAATAGQKGKVFLFGLGAVLLIFALQLTCCGTFIGMPLVGVAWAVMCLRLSGRGVPMAAAAPPGYGGPPPGYGGPPPGYGPPPGAPPGGYGPPPGAPPGGYGPPGGGYGGGP